MKPLIYHWRCLPPYFFLIFPISSTVSIRLYWGVLIYFFLLPQIGMTRPAYDQQGRFHTDNKHICDFLWDFVYFT